MVEANPDWELVGAQAGGLCSKFYRAYPPWLLPMSALGAVKTSIGCIICIQAAIKIHAHDLNSYNCKFSFV
jgi:hypothetical protein